VTRIDPLRFQAEGRRQQTNWALVFGFILCCSIFCHACMFAWLCLF